MSERPARRLDAARRRAAAVKRGLAIASAAAFGLAAIWAHDSHPGTPAVSSGGVVTLDDDANDGIGFDFGSGSLAPSTQSTPDTGTHVS